MRNQAYLVEVLEGVEQIKPLLAGKKPEVIGAVLGNLLAIWLAGHRSTDNRQEDLWDSLLADHLMMVRELTPVERQIRDANYE